MAEKLDQFKAELYAFIEQMTSLKHMIELKNLAANEIRKERVALAVENATVEKDKIMIEIVEACLWAYNFSFDEYITMVQQLYSMPMLTLIFLRKVKMGRTLEPRTVKMFFHKPKASPSLNFKLIFFIVYFFLLLRISLVFIKQTL